jgi:hypothetical protein
VLPCTAQCPAIDGDSVGIGEFEASGAENCTRMGLVPLTAFAPAAGVIETSCSAAAGSSGLVAFSGPSDDTSEAWLPGDANATNTTPDPRTSAAPVAVRTAPRRFGRVTPNDCQDLLVLVGEFSLSASNDGFFRNHPDPDTALFPSTRYHNLTKFQALNPGGKLNKTTTPHTHRRASGEKGCRFSAIPPGTGSGPSPASELLLSVIG